MCICGWYLKYFPTGSKLAQFERTIIKFSHPLMGIGTCPGNHPGSRNLRVNVPTYLCFRFAYCMTQSIETHPFKRRRLVTFHKEKIKQWHTCRIYNIVKFINIATIYSKISIAKRHESSKKKKKRNNSESPETAKQVQTYL